MNLWLALAAWIGVSVPVTVALGILLGRAKAPHHHHAVSPGRLTRI